MNQDRIARTELPGQGCLIRVASTRLQGHDNYRAEWKGKAYKAARTGQQEWDRQNKTARTELTEQGCQHRAAKIRKHGQDNKERTAEKTARTGQLDRTGRSIQPERVSQDKTSRTGQADKRDRTGLLAQHCQDSTARTGCLEQDRQDRITGDMTVRKGKPEQNSPNGTNKRDRKMMACTTEMP
jgi:hypothetical protein